MGRSYTGQPRVRMEDEVGEKYHWSTPCQDGSTGLGRVTLVDPVSGGRMGLGKSNTGRPRVRIEGEVGKE